VVDSQHSLGSAGAVTLTTPNAGVRQQRVQRPAGDAHYVVIDLDFGTTGDAASFLSFLQATVWTSGASSPALVGTPRTAILELAEPAS
jgi:hypothetical protein